MSTHDLTTRMVHCTPHPSSSGTFERVNGESRTQLRADGAEARRSRPANKRRMLFRAELLLDSYESSSTVGLLQNSSTTWVVPTVPTLPP